MYPCWFTGRSVSNTIRHPHWGNACVRWAYRLNTYFTSYRWRIFAGLRADQYQRQYVTHTEETLVFVIVWTLSLHHTSPILRKHPCSVSFEHLPYLIQVAYLCWFRGRSVSKTIHHPYWGIQPAIINVCVIIILSLGNTQISVLLLCFVYLFVELLIKMNE